MLLRSPWNIHDDQAVAVHTLSGSLIGWVPRADNGRFQQQELVFGRVEFVGAAPGSEAWGVRAVAQPALMPASVSPFPWALLPAAKPVAAVSAAAGKKTALRGRATAAAETVVDPVVSASGLATLEAALGPGSWKKLSIAASQISRGLCEVTGASPAALGGKALELVPVWQYRDDKRVVKVNKIQESRWSGVSSPFYHDIYQYEDVSIRQVLPSACSLLL